MSAGASAAFEDLRIDTRSIGIALWRRKLRILLVSALLAALTWLYLSTLTPMYEATASLLVESRLAGDAASGVAADEAAVESQVQLAQSRETLQVVIEAESLRDAAELNRPALGIIARFLTMFGWTPSTSARFVSDDALIAELRDRLVVAREGDSRVFSIRLRAEDPDLAARVVDAIAQAHVERRTEQVRSSATGATAWLEREIAGLRARVAEAESKVASFRAGHDLAEGSENSSVLEQQLSQLSAQFSAASGRQSTVENQARLIRGLIDAGQPVETIEEVRESPVVQQLAQQKAALQGQRAERAAALEADHPDLLALDARIAELTSAIQAEGNRIAGALDSQAALEAERSQSLSAELARLRTQATAATVNGIALAQLERDAAAERDLLNAFMVRYREEVAASNSNSVLPDVRIVSTAAEPTAPVYPQKSLPVFAVFMISLVLQAGGIVLGELAGGTVFVPRLLQPRDDAEPVADPVEPNETEVPPAPEPEPDIAAEESPPFATPERPKKIRWRIPRFWRRAQVSPAVDDQGANDAVPGSFDSAAAMTGLPAAPMTGLPQVEPAAWPEARRRHIEDEPDEPRELRDGPPRTGPIAALAALVASLPETRPERPAPQRIAAAPVEPEEVELPEIEAFTPPEDHFIDVIESAPEEAMSEEVEVPVEPISPAGEEEDFDLQWDEALQWLAKSPVEAEPAGMPVALASAVEPSLPAREAASGEHRQQFGKSAEHIAMHLAANNVRVALVASAEESREDRSIAGRIAVDLLGVGNSACVVDAGGRAEADEGVGLTDLCAGLADFGEVVHRIDGENLYHVPWGRQYRLDPSSPRIPTLIEALNEIHDHVIILAGPMETQALLPVFASPRAALIIAGSAETSVERIAIMSNLGREAGYGHVSLARTEDEASEVA